VAPSVAQGEQPVNPATELGQAAQRPAAKLTGGSLVSRLMAIGLVLAGIAGLFANAGGWLTPKTLTPARLADTFQLVNGLHPGFRRNHAKGVCVSGYFDSNGKGAVLSKASI